MWYNEGMNYEAKIKFIKSWLGSGSINIFGVPFAGKDTLGNALAKILGAEFISSGDIIRSNSSLFTSKAVKETNKGSLTPTNEFEKVVLPYFGRKALAGKPLILSSVGRWEGEEYKVMNTLIKYNHPTKAVLVMDLSRQEVINRWKTNRDTTQGRDIRKDDRSERIIKRRLKEFDTKTQPVIDFYAKIGIAYRISSDQPREGTLNDAIETLVHIASK